ncbi:hypothetical protein V4P56_04485 [Bartonella sp. B35(2025)]
MVKMFKKNISLCISTVAICSFLQVAGAYANFEKGKFQHTIVSAMAVQEDVKTMNVAIVGIPNESVEKKEEFEKISAKNSNIKPSGISSAFSHKNFGSFFTNLFSDFMRFFSKIAKMI